MIAFCGNNGSYGISQIPEKPLPNDVLQIVKEIEQTYIDHPGFKHYLWDFMEKGEYDIDFLKKFALMYYEHVRVFRLYLAGFSFFLFV